MIRSKNLVLFPFDEQLCGFRMESYSMRSSQLKLAYMSSKYKIFNPKALFAQFSLSSIVFFSYFWTLFVNHRGSTEKTISLNKNIKIPAFEITGCYRDTEQCDRQLATGSFSCVTMFLRLKRFSSYYLLNVYLPTGLCVIVSWTTFWIRLDIAPARVTLCKIFLTRRRPDLHILSIFTSKARDRASSIAWLTRDIQTSAFM